MRRQLKKISFLILLSTLTPLFTHAQKIDWKLQAGTGIFMNKIVDDPYNEIFRKAHFNLGTRAEKRFGKFSGEVGAILLMYNAKTIFSYEALDIEATEIKSSNYELLVPILAGYNFSNFKISAGPALEFFLWQKFKYDGEVTDSGVDYKTLVLYSDVRLGYYFGGDDCRFFVELNYNRSLTDQTNQTGVDEGRSNNLFLNLGIKL